MYAGKNDMERNSGKCADKRYNGSIRGRYAGSRACDGRLLEDKVITHNVEKEFLALMEKYHIPCVYDSTEEVYVIYGYQ